MIMRLLLALLALWLPATLWAEEAPKAEQAEDPVIFTGVVNWRGYPYKPNEYREAYSFDVQFLAWRQGDGPVETVQANTYVRTKDEAEFERFKDLFQRGALVQLAIDGPVKFEEDAVLGRTAFAVFVDVLAPVQDAELSAAADRVLNPLPFEDPVLGQFEPVANEFTLMVQKREWFGDAIPFELILEPLGPDARDRAIAMARMAWEDREAIDKAIRRTVTERIYGTEEEPTEVDPRYLPPLTSDEFETDHILRNVACGAQNFCVFFYKPQVVTGWGYRAIIERDGDGWVVADHGDL